ncbi:MAG: M28 family peptidase [Clostridiales Family XIII bacterium]|jgi:hypothetical protein|nr:M28 family peptidase [Clostridiales Family XIII bacterium]
MRGKTIVGVARLAMALAGISICLILAGCSGGKGTADLGEEIVVSGFSADYSAFEAAVDIEFSRSIMEELSRLGDDPRTGFRTAGSPAEKRAADIVERYMIQAGLKNIVRDAVMADGWTFGGATLAYESFRGTRAEIVLGGYPTHMVAEGAPMMLVDLGAGDSGSYEGRDVEGKLALVDADAESGDRVDFQVWQAKAKGAAAVLVMAQAAGGGDEALMTRGLWGQPGIPVFAVSAADAAALRVEMRKAEDGEIPVIIDADSVLAPEAGTEIVWGEIPGRSEEAIYVTANYDGFYHSIFENAVGVSTVIGIAKAMADSGVAPQKTVRFVACGAGEWGAAAGYFSWGAGIWKQISQGRPDWPGSAFAVLNIDGLKPLSNKTDFSMKAAGGILGFARRSAGQLIDKSYYDFTWPDESSPAAVTAEEAVWALTGVPYVAAGADSSDAYLGGLYHSSVDAAGYGGFDEGAYSFAHMIFGKLIMDLDRELVRPVDFGPNFRDIIASYSGGASTNSALVGALAAAEEKAAVLAGEIEKLNAYYLTAPEAMRPGVEEMAYGLNRALFRVGKSLRDNFSRLTWEGGIAYPHYAAQSNVRALREAEVLLEMGDGEGALKALDGVGFARYAPRYGDEAMGYVLGIDNTGTWAEGHMPDPPCDANGVAAGLARKNAEGDSDFSEELQEIEFLIGEEALRYREILEGESAAASEIAGLIEQILSDYFEM